MSERTYPLFEFDQINVRGSLVIDESKGLVERVFVESVNACGANEYMESIGANFNDYCSCCGYRWYRASRPVGELDDIDVRYSKERVAVHYKDGSFVIWTPKRYAKPEPKPFNDLASGNPFIIRCDPVTEESYAVESERIAEATKPRYKAYASECESPEEALLERVRRDHEEYKTVEAIKAEILSAITKTLSDI